MNKYEEFIRAKQFGEIECGFDVQSMNPKLFDHQKAIVRWSVKRGRAAIFADTGLGKSAMEMEFAAQVTEQTGRPVLIVAPLCVAKQFVREGKKFGYDVHYCREQMESRDGINITNYEMLDAFDLHEFSGIVLDESSILKNSTGKTRTAIIKSCQQVQYRLSATATPSPNDWMELGNQAEFLGLMTQAEMLAMFFTHDGGETQKWRLKGHGAAKFWEWMANWSVCIRKPSDLGFSDDGYDLPPLTLHEHVVEAHKPLDGQLFVTTAQTLTERRQAQRESLRDRVDAVSKVVLNSCSDKLAELILASESHALEARARRKQTEEREGEPGVPSEKDQAGRCQGQGFEKAVHEGLREKEPGEIQKDFGATGGGQQAASREVRQGQGISRFNQENSRRLAREKPGCQKEAENQKVRVDTGSVPGASGSCRSSVPDMRVLGEGGQKHVPGDRPQPHHRESARRALHELQYGDWETSGFCGQLGSRNQVPAKLPKWLIWCHLNDEQDALKKSLQSLVISIAGADPIHKKESGEAEWRLGATPVIVTKPKIFGHGLNWQHCARMAFVGLSDSFEQYYQAVRRCYRFGQKRPVDVHIVTAETEGAVKANIQRKQAQAANGRSDGRPHARANPIKNQGGHRGKDRIR